MRKIFSLLLVVAGMLCSTQSVWAVEVPANAKAYGYAQVGPGENPAVWGDAAVLSDYSAYLRLPDKTKQVKLTDTIYADVFAGSRHKSFSYNTGIVLPNAETIAKSRPEWDQCTNEACRQYLIGLVQDSLQKRVTVSLGNAAEQGGLTVENFYTFTNATVNVTVMTEGGFAEGGQEKYFTYNLTGGNVEGFRMLAANPADKTAVDAAIELVKTVVEKQTSGVTELCIKAGSYVQYGVERLDFKNDVVLDKSQMTYDKLLRAISENTDINYPGISTGDPCELKAFLIAGSYVCARGRKAVLKEGNDMTVTVSNLGLNSDPLQMPKLLSALKGYADEKKRTEFFRTLVSFANNMAALIEGKTIPVLVEFDYVPWDVIRGVEEVMNPGNTEALSAGKIGTFCLPWSVSQVRGGSVYSLEYKIGEGDAVEAVALVQAEYPLVARRPYVFVASSDKLEGILGDETYLTDPEPLSFHGLVGGKFYEATTVAAGNYLITGNMLRLCNVECYVAPGRAYVNMAAVPDSAPVNPAPGRRMLIGKQGIASDVINNEAGAQVVKAIVDGEFVIIKNGVKYNAAGVVVE